VKRILVIDDEAFVARLIGQVLQAANVEHILEYCSDGGLGRAMADQGHYDLITLDLGMPHMDGVEALQELKRNPKSAHIPVVVVTGKRNPYLHERVMELGAVAVVTKPFDTRELGNILRLIIARAEAEPPNSRGPSSLPPA